jgi:predicted nuclease of predicted toxin-antitoxin system
MRFLVDECLSTRTLLLFREAGHDVVHVADLGMLGAPDEAVMAAAAEANRILLSADTDFGELLSVGRHIAPSVVLFRGTATPERRAEILLGNLDLVADDLDAGAIVVFSPGRVRIRALPVD